MRSGGGFSGQDKKARVFEFEILNPFFEHLQPIKLPRQLAGNRGDTGFWIGRQVTGASRSVKRGLGGQPVAVRIVTPDPDFVELALPCVTLQLTDVRRDPSRRDNDRRVEKDIEAMTATVRPPTEPYDMHFAIGVHGESTRAERLMLEQVLCRRDERPAMTTVTPPPGGGPGREVYLSRDVSFRDFSKGRAFWQTVGIVVRTRLEPGEARVVPLVREHIVGVKEV